MLEIKKLHVEGAPNVLQVGVSSKLEEFKKC